MPDDRFFHKRAGHSKKVNSLTDFEELAWRYYVESADDFGVMRFSALTLMAEHDRMAAKKNPQIVQRALERVRDVELIVTFEHQGDAFCCQLDWQSWQKVKHPRHTINPKPPVEILARCDAKTRGLFADWPGKSKQKVGEDSGNPSEMVGDLARADARETAMATAMAGGSVGGAGDSASPVVGGFTRPASHPARAHGLGTLSRSHLNHAWCGERICVPDFLHEQFVKAVGAPNAAAELRAFYAAEHERIPDSQAIESDVTKFWRPRVSARWPPPVAATGKTAGNLAAAQQFIARGQK